MYISHKFSEQEVSEIDSPLIKAGDEFCCSYSGYTESDTNGFVSTRETYLLNDEEVGSEIMDLEITFYSTYLKKDWCLFLHEYLWEVGTQHGD